MNLRSHYVTQGNTNIPCSQSEHNPIVNEPRVLDKSQLDPVVTSDNNPSNTDMTGSDRSENLHTDSKNYFAVKVINYFNELFDKYDIILLQNIGCLTSRRNY